MAEIAIDDDGELVEWEVAEYEWCIVCDQRATEVGTSVCHRCMDGEPE